MFMLMSFIMHREDDAPEEEPRSTQHEEKRTSEIQMGTFAMESDTTGEKEPRLQQSACVS